MESCEIFFVVNYFYQQNASLIAYAFVQASLSDTTFMGGEYLNESRKVKWMPQDLQ